MITTGRCPPHLSPLCSSFTYMSGNLLRVQFEGGVYYVSGVLTIFLATLCSMWDLSSLTRDRTHAPPLQRKHRVLTTGLSGKSLGCMGYHFKTWGMRVPQTTRKGQKSPFRMNFQNTKQFTLTSILHEPGITHDGIQGR